MADWDNRLPHDTPKRSKVQGAVEYLEAKGIPHYKEDIFQHFEVSHCQGWAMISDDSLQNIERMIQDEGFEVRAYTWDTLAYEAGLSCSGRTLQRALGRMDYHKCIACRKGWCGRDLKETQKEYAKMAKAMRPEPEDWDNVRFSDEVHFALGPQGRIYIIRKPGEQYCSNCIQHQNEPTPMEKEMNKIHAWAAIGYNFKSPLTFYNISSNKNGKMTQCAYIDQVLKPLVKPWVDRGDRFWLEEDNNSGHGPGKSNIVRTFKKDNSIQSFFNAPSSPDLALIENCWQPPKQYIKKFPHWDEDDTWELALEGWDKVTQELQDCIDVGGEMTGW
ncbi:hypothetical protein BU25DRAFT_431205 [Macroventuria anomochaeta]|uniref:Uncharacterized protein n=1 Tax=Macroventuria anomochaeta TaxID=301207 RepID=A0ACB6S178_9PLEO|nr:uncharacterized protein BU25DRAFT_431205 [Macroventuria anomochaeta]KAF2627901.1 hypothetical protein BU25DRAFT_431205 [Macroventuria anomochaeta]